MSATPANIAEALRQTFLQLDEKFLASNSYSESVRPQPLPRIHHTLRSTTLQ
jgi:hypothetical protein